MSESGLMKRPFSHYWRRGFVATVLVVPAMIVSPHLTHAFTPKSPEVKAMVARGVTFLESKGGDDPRMGAQALVALALYENHCGAAHPRVVQAVETIRHELGNLDPEKVKLGQSQIYEAGLAAIFLIKLDPVAYSREIECLLAYLQLRQKPHGGWGYFHEEIGDTSMTQYGVLSAWEANKAGFEVPIGSIERVATWLLKTQDPSGGHAYKGKTSDSFVPIAQSRQSLGMTAAGVGSLYISAHLLGVMTRKDRPDNALPNALKEVKPEAPETKVKTQIPAAMFQAAQGRGTGWLQRNYKIDPKGYTHYYLYALERCMSFREYSEKGPNGKIQEDSPIWYNDGVRYLMKTQAESGNWESDSPAGAFADTAFGILFLLRSTGKSLGEMNAKLGDGTLVGGRGLPKESDQALVRDGEVIARPLLGPAEQLLAMLEGSEGADDLPDYDQTIDLLAELPPQEAAKLVGQHAEQLRQLVGDWSPEARLAAVRALAKTRDLDNVPTLIYALTDPNFEVARGARTALRRLSRRPSGYGMPDEPTAGERLTAIRKWKAWYLAIRPDAKFRPIKFGE